jgi:FkbM family methyltransferase
MFDIMNNILWYIEYREHMRPKLSPIARRLADLYWKGAIKGTVEQPVAGGRYLSINGRRFYYSHRRVEADSQLREIFQGEYYACRKEPGHIIDVGSNNGSSVLWFKLMSPETAIDAFEPFPASYKYLEANVQEHCLENVVTYNYALSDHAGSMDFYYYDDQGASNGLYSNAYDVPPQGAITVKTSLLSDHIKEPAGLVKLDVEGSEGAIIEDLIRSGKIEMVNEIVFEYHPHCPVSLPVMLSDLKSNGMEIDIKSKIPGPFDKAPERLLVRAWRPS